MSFQDWGNPPIPSTGFVPVAAPSTATLLAELDSTMLGTKDFALGQTAIFAATYVLGADTNVTWQVGVCTSTALNAGVDELYPKTVTAQSAQFVVKHVLGKDYRIRARLFSTGANAAAYITAERLT